MLRPRTPAHLLLTVTLIACGPSKPPPEEPKHETPALGGPSQSKAPESDMAMSGEGSEEAEEPSSGSSSAEASPRDEPTAAEPAKPEPEQSGSKPSRPPSETLTGAKISYMINFPSSEPKAAAEKKCSAEAGEDMAARAKCIGEQRKEFLADVLVFKKDPKGSLELFVYRRAGNQLIELSTNAFEFANETANTVTLKIGKGTGARPLFFGAKEVTISVPSDSSLELQDPRYGHLVYEAKIGLVGN